MSYFDDQSLINSYVSLGESVDRIACFRFVREQFVTSLPSHLRDTDHDELIWRLFQLRKAGKLNTKHLEN